MPELTQLTNTGAGIHTQVCDLGPECLSTSPYTPLSESSHSKERASCSPPGSPGPIPPSFSLFFPPLAPCPLEQQAEDRKIHITYHCFLDFCVPWNEMY